MSNSFDHSIELVSKIGDSSKYYVVTFHIYDHFIMCLSFSGLKMCEYYTISPEQNLVSATRDFQFSIAKKL